MDDTRFVPDAILLAAGLGTRMRPLTDLTPKPLLPVAGTTLIERVAANAHHEGVSRFVVNAHHLAGQIEQALPGLADRLSGSQFQLSPEHKERQETGGGAKQALGLTKTDPVLVMNTDAFWPLAADRPISRMLAHAAQRQDDVILLCAHPVRALGFRRSHDFCLNPAGSVTLDSGLPVIYAGVALLPRAVFADTPAGPFSLNLLLERALKAGRLTGVLLDAPWLHVGDPEALAAAEAFLAEG